MEIERQRSLSTSVLHLITKRKINILDTPGHKDFAKTPLEP
jgi:peptide subunit release factor RF-3